MFVFIGGLPPDVLAIEARGEVTHDDYRKTLIPNAEEMMARGPIKMLYVIGEEFTGFQIEALSDDTVFGLMHWHEFSHIAVVTDHGWVNALVNMFKPFFPGDVRLFKLAELPVAKDWITKARVGTRP